MRNVISFCVWGKNPLYNYGVYENALRLPNIFPGWYMVIYYTKTADLQVMQEIAKLPNIILFEIDLPDNYRNSMLRFIAGFNPTYDAVIFRDADSRINRRDAKAVEEWLKTGKPIHIMRDHPANGTKFRISAGLWGARNGFIKKPEIREKYIDYFCDPNKNRWTIDEKFLFDAIYPLVNESNSVVHSDFKRFEKWATGFPNGVESRKKDGFCGMTRPSTPNASKKFNNPNVTHKKYRANSKITTKVNVQAIAKAI